MRSVDGWARRKYTKYLFDIDICLKVYTSNLKAFGAIYKPQTISVTLRPFHFILPEFDLSRILSRIPDQFLINNYIDLLF